MATRILEEVVLQRVYMGSEVERTKGIPVAGDDFDIKALESDYRNLQQEAQSLLAESAASYGSSHRAVEYDGGGSGSSMAAVSPRVSPSSVRSSSKLDALKKLVHKLLHFALAFIKQAVTEALSSNLLKDPRVQQLILRRQVQLHIQI